MAYNSCHQKYKSDLSEWFLKSKTKSREVVTTVYIYIKTNTLLKFTIMLQHWKYPGALDPQLREA